MKSPHEKTSITLESPLGRRKFVELSALGATAIGNARLLGLATGAGTLGLTHEAAAQESELVIAQALPILELDSSLYAGNVVQSAALHVIEPLIRREADLTLQPYLAEEWNYVDDQTLHFRIREGVVFHNGDPLTVDDVVFTLQRVISPESVSDHATFMTSAISAEAIDERTVELKTSQPDARLLGRLALIGIVPQSVVEESGWYGAISICKLAAG
jgi:peptide/nickel transport system substrate-binding protein